MNREAFRDVAQLAIGLVLIAGCFGFLYLLFFSGRPVDASLKDSTTLVTGSVLTILGGIAGYYYGSSLSSARKDSTIATKGAP